MGDDEAGSAEAFLTLHPVGPEAYARVLAACVDVGPVTVRVTKTQLALSRRRSFAWLWWPERWLHDRSSGIIVLSLALGRKDPSPRWKQVVQPTPDYWMHHLEVRSAAEVDDEVAAWIREAAADAS